MIRPCSAEDTPQLLEIINDGAEAYRGIIPADRWSEPYMPLDHLEHELAAGVAFHAFPDASDPGHLLGVMGIQQVEDVTLIRHAYVRTAAQKQGIGAHLLEHLQKLIDRPILIGTWADATWAIRFYQRHGFEIVSPEEKNRLLKKYWTVPDRQVETSVVLADANWRSRQTPV